jgi:hypothetical protein
VQVVFLRFRAPAERVADVGDAQRGPSGFVADVRVVALVLHVRGGLFPPPLNLHKRKARNAKLWWKAADVAPALERTDLTKLN